MCDLTFFPLINTFTKSHWTANWSLSGEKVLHLIVCSDKSLGKGRNDWINQLAMSKWDMEWINKFPPCVDQIIMKTISKLKVQFTNWLSFALLQRSWWSSERGDRRYLRFFLVCGCVFSSLWPPGSDNLGELIGPSDLWTSFSTQYRPLNDS